MGSSSAVLRQLVVPFLLSVAVVGGVPVHSHAGAGKVPPIVASELVARFSWLRTKVGEVFLEKFTFEGEWEAAERRLHEIAESVERKLERARKDRGSFGGGGEFSPEEIRILRDAVEQASGIRLGKSRYRDTRDAFLNDKLDLVPSHVEHLELRAGKATIHEVDFVGSGRPAIMAHGLIEEPEILAPIAAELNMAYDYHTKMIALRGHGRGAGRSTVSNYQRGDYGARYMAEQDIPAAIARAKQDTGQEPFLIGHSMGGMVIRGIPTETIAGRVEIGSPWTMEDLSLYQKILARIGSAWHTKTPLGFDFNLTFNQWGGGPENANLIRKAIRGLFRGVVDPVALKLVSEGFLNPKNVTLDEFRRLRELVLSDLNSDMQLDFSIMGTTGRPAVDGLVTPQNARYDKPTLVVAGELDVMARAKPIIEGVQGLPKGSLAWPALMLRTGHMDLVWGDAARRRLAPFLHRFMQDPYQFGPPGTLIIIP